MFVVYDNNKPARYPFYKVDPEWGCCEFNLLDKAVEYANRWLDRYGPLPIDYKVGDAYEYSPYGDTIVIKEV